MHLSRSSVIFSLVIAANTASPSWSPQLKHLLEQFMVRGLQLPPDDFDQSMIGAVRQLLADARALKEHWLDTQLWECEQLAELFTRSVVENRLGAFVQLIEYALAGLTTEDDADALSYIQAVGRQLTITGVAGIDVMITRQLNAHKKQHIDASFLARQSVTMAA